MMRAKNSSTQSKAAIAGKQESARMFGEQTGNDQRKGGGSICEKKINHFKVGGGKGGLRKCHLFMISWSLPLYGFWLPPTAY
jgi:hypothetical protein